MTGADDAERSISWPLSSDLGPTFVESSGPMDLPPHNLSGFLKLMGQMFKINLEGKTSQESKKRKRHRSNTEFEIKSIKLWVSFISSCSACLKMLKINILWSQSSIVTLAQSQIWHIPRAPLNLSPQITHGLAREDLISRMMRPVLWFVPAFPY
jgi:hypothetical protein